MAPIRICNLAAPRHRAPPCPPEPVGPGAAHRHRRRGGQERRTAGVPAARGERRADRTLSRASSGPALARGGSTALFPGRSAARTVNILRAADHRQSVFTHTGMRVNPHLFRHIGAKSVPRRQSRRRTRSSAACWAIARSRRRRPSTPAGDGRRRPALRRDHSEAAARRAWTMTDAAPRPGSPVPAAQPNGRPPTATAGRLPWLPGDLLDEGGARARYADASNRKVAEGLRPLAGLALRGKGCSIADCASRGAHHAGAGEGVGRRPAARGLASDTMLRGCRHCMRWP